MGMNARLIAAEVEIASVLARIEVELGREVAGVYVEAVEIGVCGVGAPQVQRHISIELRTPTGARWAKG